VKFSEIINSAKVIQVIGSEAELEIRGISFDSREIKEGWMFVAIKGFQTDGHKFISQAIANGANVIAVEEGCDFDEDIIHNSKKALVVVENSRKALAEFSNIFYGKPSEKLTVIGITGTKGKTTTSYYLKNILETAGKKVGLIGTIQNMIGDKVVKTNLTTPEANEINRLMNTMVAEGCEYCVMEASSHSLELYRVHGIDFDYALFTNLTSDHMDFHKTKENYLKAKKILFNGLKADSKAIFNKDDENYELLLKDAEAEKYSYGVNESADFRIENVEFDFSGTNFSVAHNGEKFAVKTKLVGFFNAYNAGAAFATAYLAGVGVDEIIRGIETTPQIPGRFEVISNGKKKAIIDFSHTAGSLKEALISVNKIVENENPPSPVYTVFGCGGDRDKTKRPLMGKYATEMSKKAFVTSDNPRTEEPMKIIDDILKGIEKENYEVIENREEAIKKSIMETEENAVILIAGKGHEDYQLINGVKHHFSDKETAQKYLDLCRN